MACYGEPPFAGDNRTSACPALPPHLPAFPPSPFAAPHSSFALRLASAEALIEWQKRQGVTRMLEWCTGMGNASAADSDYDFAPSLGSGRYTLPSDLESEYAQLLCRNGYRRGWPGFAFP